MAVCPNPADHSRIASLELQVQALKAELRSAEKREAELREKVESLSPPEPVTAYTLVRDAFKSAPVNPQDQEMRMTRGFSDNDLGVCLRVLHSIVMRPSLVPEFSQKLRVAKSLFERPDPMPVIKIKAPVRRYGPASLRVLKEEDRVRRFAYCKMQRDYFRDLNNLRKELPDVSLDNTPVGGFLERTEELYQRAHSVGEVSPVLHRATQCWSCHAQFKVLHPVYEKLCQACAQLNVEKRLAHADLSNRVAVVTGGRVRIGFQVTLKLLRMGASVVVTTRFPVNAILELSKVSDFNSWKDRLLVYGLDLRSPLAVERFTADLAARFPRIDVLINNAAQTIAKPPGFYASLMAIESQGASALPAPLRANMLHDNRTLVQVVSPSVTIPAESLDDVLQPAGELVATNSTLGVPVVSKPTLDNDASVPVRWAEGDQLDLRATNTWVTAMKSVSTEELVEVQAVNVIAPFILMRNLRPMLAAARGAYVVNVSAMEGQFYRWKSSYHPHTNMAKAALNMLTRTLGTDFATTNINLTVVDTGWVTDELPLPMQAMRSHPFIPPLGTEDGAARILDPIIMGVNGEPLRSGVFYKDFKPTYW